MKKIFNSILSVAAVVALVLSCAREEMAPEGDNAGPTITINASIADLFTKVAFDPTYDGTYGKPESMDLSWADGDKLRIYNHDDRSEYSDFELDPACVGQKTGTFTGSLVAASSWDVEIFNGSLNYAAQTQPSDGVTTGLKYLASVSDVDDVAVLHFTDFSSVLAITTQMPSSAIAAMIKSVDVTASADIFNGGNTLSITFASIGDADSDGVLHFFATLPQGDQAIPAGTTLLVKFNAPGETHDVYTRFITLGAKTFTHNKLNTININATNSASYANGSTTNIGTESNPYLIGDKYQMDKMREYLENGKRTYFKMVDDVDLKNVNWVPVSQNADAQADFNGNGHIIYNLTIDATSASYTYVGFFGLLYGNVHDVMFDGANVNGGAKLSAIVMGRTGASSYAAEFSNVTVRNSTLTASNNYVGGICGYVKKSNGFSKCQVIDCSITNTITGTTNNVGGLVGWMGPNGGCTMTDCSAERVTVNGGVTNTNQSGIGGLIGRIEGNGVVITRCHSSGTIAQANTNNVGGLVGDIASGTGIQIKNSYSTAKIQRGYTNVGGLVGRIKPDTGVTIDHCYASGNLELKGGYGGKGGLVGIVLSPDVTVKESIAWNSKISAGHATGDAGTGALVGVAWPTCTLTKNYRKPSITYNGLYWTPSESWDHPDVNSTNKLVVLDTGDPVESKAARTDATSITLDSNSQPASQYNWAYHGHKITNGAVVSPDNTYGWISDKQVGDITVPEDTDPENPSYTGNNVWGLGSTVEIVDGVQWTNYHGTWEGSIREINIITTALNEHNKLGIYYNYTDNGKLYLDEKCVFVDAVAGTNGSMTSQFIRVNDIVKRTGNDSGGDWLHNCALIVDGEEVDIVKVNNNADAATLPNHTVSCAGPLLVWKGNKLTASSEWLAADTGKWLTTGGNTGGQPRTAIGINKEGTKVIQVTVDGRWTSSGDDKTAYGMATDLLAELMLELGCYKAMNLDGGGGSQMWVYGKGDIHNIVNHPHNTWPTYEDGSKYYWIKNGEVARRTSCCAVYIQSDLK